MLAGMGQLWAADSLRVGLIRYKDEASFKATYEPLMTYLAEKLQQPLKLEILPEDELGYRLAHAIPHHAYVLAPGLPQEERERIKTIMFLTAACYPSILL
ncbi:MAG: hypothetical protein D6730_15590 [Bacteroidetes bacterium]|nr:MAG: hypothetical protein D6730_15590 [Bacteroidota bacterium]